MAIKKIEIRPESNNDYGDVLYPKTSVDLVENIDRYGLSSGTNDYTVSIPDTPLLFTGLRILVKFPNASTGASTINVNGLGSKSIIKAGGGSPNIKAGAIYSLVYDGTNFQLQGEGGEYGTAQASDVLSGKTIGTEDGLVTGTMPTIETTSGTIKISTETSQNGGSTLLNISPNQVGYATLSSNIQVFIGNLISHNVKKGVTIASSTGTYTGEGNATTSQVLSGATFSTATLSNATGTMNNYGSTSTSLAPNTSITNIANSSNGVDGFVDYKSPITGYVNTSTTLRHSIKNMRTTNIANGVKVGTDSKYITGTYKGLGNASTSQVLSGRKFSTATLSNASGTMPNRGSVSKTLTTQGGAYTIPSGYHGGSGKVTASFANLSAGNIKKGVNVGGVVGNLVDGSNMKNVKIGSVTSNSTGKIILNPGFKINYFFAWTDRSPTDKKVDFIFINRDRTNFGQYSYKVYQMITGTNGSGYAYGNDYITFSGNTATIDPPIAYADTLYHYVAIGD